MDIKRVRPRRLYEDVLEQLHTLINSDAVDIGDTLPPERDLAEQFGVSRGTLREAFRILESTGYIQSTPGGGRYVAQKMKETNLSQLISSFETASVEELYEVRGILEPAVAEFAALRATKEDIEELEEILQKTSRVESKENLNFHIALSNAAHNYLMADIIQANLAMIERDEQQKKIYQRKNEINAEHQAIVEAIKRKDAKEAGNQMKEHIENGRRNLKQRRS